MLQKIDPTKPFGKFNIEVEAKGVVKSSNTSNLSSNTGGDYVSSGIGTGGNSHNHEVYASAVASIRNFQTGGQAQDAFFVTGSSYLNSGAGGRR